ncbi:MAG: PepSY domain-containing protein [Gammaproteobacteria bacterium]|nr:PepSY domain-containing protein [Gammaproteobacteria bacterium]
MHPLFPALVTAIAIAAALPGHATGLATCDSGPRETWQPQQKLQKMLEDKGWQIRRIKEDGGCYEVYALNEKGERVEAYFHPVTLASVPTRSRR